MRVEFIYEELIFKKTSIHITLFRLRSNVLVIFFYDHKNIERVH